MFTDDGELIPDNSAANHQTLGMSSTHFKTDEMVKNDQLIKDIIKRCKKSRKKTIKQIKKLDLDLECETEKDKSFNFVVNTLRELETTEPGVMNTLYDYMV